MLRNAINSPMLKALSIALMLGLVAVSAPTPAFADDDHREPNYHPDFHNGRYLPHHGKRHDGHYSKRYYKKRHYRKHRHRDHDDHAAGLAIGLFALRRATITRRTAIITNTITIRATTAIAATATTLWRLITDLTILVYESA